MIAASLSLEEEQAHLALMEHGLALGKFVTGEEPPAIVDDERLAKLIFTGIAHLTGLTDAQRALIEEYDSWAEEMRRRVAVLTALVCDSPALEAWRKLATADRRRPVLERMAAWELTAIVCDVEKNHELAEAARQTARHIAPRVRR